MHLTAEEAAMRESGPPAVRKAMELLVKLGDIYGADGLISIDSAQASGISYKSIGDPGVTFLEGFAEEGARVNVPTFANPAGMDLERWQEMGVSESFARQQRRILKALDEMGVMLSFTCTPYLAGNVPRRGAHLAWAESSAVSYANAVLGARTNREGGPAALAAGITGRTPKYGLHLEENRQPTELIEVDTALDTPADFATLGAWAGELVEDGIPYFTGIQQAQPEELKTLGAAMAATGAVAHYYVEGVTTDRDCPEMDAIVFDDYEKQTQADALSDTDTFDLVVFGCPHCSIAEIREIAAYLEGETLACDLWVCTSQSVKSLADRNGFTETIEAAGGLVLADTCNVVSPIEALGYEATATDSAKAATYLPGFCDQEVVFGERFDLLDRVIEG